MARRGRNSVYSVETFQSSMNLLRDMDDLQFNSGILDRTDPESVKTRILKYFGICERNNTRPLVSGFATTLGMRRKELLMLVQGADVFGFTPESAEVVRYYYSQMEIGWDYAMNNGGIDRVCGIFLGKNNFGYADQQEIIHVGNQSNAPQLTMADIEKQLEGLPKLDQLPE